MSENSEAGGDRPEAAFETLGHEVRLGVIEELARRQRANNWQPVTASFSDLRRAVGVDDAGKFNYHLGELQGRYIRKTEEGYRLTPAGFEVASAVRRGTYTGDPDRIEGPIDHDCPGCGETFVARYEEGYLGVYCPEHGVMLGNTVPPSAAVGRDLTALVGLVERENRRYVRQLTAGSCPECYGQTEATLPATIPDDAADPVERMRDTVVAEFDCGRCGLNAFFPATMLVVEHPAATALFHDHGRDPREHGHLDLMTIVGEPTILHDDGDDGRGPRVRVDVELEGERLELVLDGAATVVGTRRLDADAEADAATADTEGKNGSETDPVADR